MSRTQDDNNLYFADQQEKAVNTLHNLIKEENENEEDIIEALWKTLIAFQNYPFYTLSGLPFSYSLKTGRDGNYTKELFIDRRKNSKSLSWSSVVRVFQNVLRLQKEQGKVPFMKGPKSLGDIRGVSYLYPVFYQIGLIDIPDRVVKNDKKIGLS